VARSKEAKECRDCGVPVLNERVHRAFHANIVTVSAQPTQQVSRLRFIGDTEPTFPEPDRNPAP